MKSSILNNANQMHDLWDRSELFVSAASVNFPTGRLQEVVSSLFCPGPSYHYVVDFSDRHITHIHPSIKRVLGLDPETVTFNDILNRVHPDDMGYVVRCEDVLLDQLYHKKGRDYATNYAFGYCFRFKVADGSYQLFHHQSIILACDEHGKCAMSMNVHTNINHITTVNNYKATLMGILGQAGFYQFNMRPDATASSLSVLLTNREMEIIGLAAKGMKSAGIADKLGISLHTVKNHRKNILQKTGAKTFPGLIARCIAEKLL